MKRDLSVLAVACALLVVTACNPFAPSQRVALGVSRIDAPATIAQTTPLTIALTVVTGGCRTFERIETQRFVTGASITVWGRDAAVGRDVACPTDIRYESHTVTFDPPFPPSSSFQISVNQGRLAPITATVQVQ